MELQRIDGDVWVGDVVLVPVAADRFFAPRDYGTVSVVPTAAGVVTGLRWDSAGVVTEMPRLPAGGCVGGGYGSERCSTDSGNGVTSTRPR